MKRLFIVNPHAGSAGPELEELRRFFTDRAGAFEHRVTASWDDARDQTTRALREGFEQIVAVGGDGTVNAVVNGFFEGGRPIETQAALAVSNTGTGSDYFKTLASGCAGRPDWREIVLRHRVQAVDVGHVLPADRYFANVASIGMSAEIVRTRENFPGSVPKTLAYLLPTLVHVLGKQAHPVELTIDGKTTETRLIAALVAKGTFMGSGMRVGGRVALDGGAFDVTLISEMPLHRMLWKLKDLYLGGLNDAPGISRVQARSLSIRSLGKALLSECDGELLTTADATVTLVPRALRVCLPAE